MIKYEVLLSENSIKFLRDLDSKDVNRIKSSLKELENYPFRRRSGADIKKLEGLNPDKYRMRIGDFRVIYVIDGLKVKIIEIIRRNDGYDWLE